MSIEMPESIAQRKGFEAGEAFGRTHCGHEAELAALRAEIIRLKEISAAFREHETLKLPEATTRYFERIIAAEPKAGVCSSLTHAIRVLCDEHTTLRAALAVAEEMAAFLDGTVAPYKPTMLDGELVGYVMVTQAAQIVARYHAARKVGK